MCLLCKAKNVGGWGVPPMINNNAQFPCMLRTPHSSDLVSRLCQMEETATRFLTKPGLLL